MARGSLVSTPQGHQIQSPPLRFTRVDKALVLGQTSTKRYLDLGSKFKKAIIERLKTTGKEKLAISLLPGNGKEVLAGLNLFVKPAVFELPHKN